MSNQQSNTPRLRPILKSIHIWIGLIAGTLISVLSLTGSVIVFQNEIAQATALRRAAAANGSGSAGLDDVARQVTSARVDARIRHVRLPARPGDPFIVQADFGGKQQRLVCDASNGQVLATLESGWIDWMIDLHRNVLAGKSGRKAVGGVGIVLFTLAATGLLLWLAGPRNWKSWILVRAQGSSRRFHFELHRAAGLWSCGLFALVSFTGIGMAYPDTYRQALQWMTGQPAASRAPRVAKTAARRLHPLDEYLRIGRDAMPDGVPVELRLPDAGKGPVDLRLWRAGDLAPDGNHVYLDPSTAKVLAVSRAADQPLAVRAFSALAPIHYGEFGGLTSKILWSVLGLVPAVLFATGIVSWWRPAKRKPQRTVEQVRTEDLTLAGR